MFNFNKSLDTYINEKLLIEKNILSELEPNLYYFTIIKDLVNNPLILNQIRYYIYYKNQYKKSDRNKYNIIKTLKRNYNLYLPNDFMIKYNQHKKYIKYAFQKYQRSSLYIDENATYDINDVLLLMDNKKVHDKLKLLYDDNLIIKNKKEDLVKEIEKNLEIIYNHNIYNYIIYRAAFLPYILEYYKTLYKTNDFNIIRYKFLLNDIDVITFNKQISELH